MPIISLMYARNLRAVRNPEILFSFFTRYSKVWKTPEKKIPGTYTNRSVFGRRFDYWISILNLGDYVNNYFNVCS
jgi:hypothetical protein